ARVDLMGAGVPCPHGFPRPTPLPPDTWETTLMAPSHAATGLLAGVLATAAVAPFMAVGPMELAAGAAIGAGAALLPDIDHPNSTATGSQGPLTRLLSAGARQFSAWVYHATLTRAR